jgi:hypothetical protein
MAKGVRRLCSRARSSYNENNRWGPASAWPLVKGQGANQVPSPKDKREKLAMMSDLFRRVYERKRFKSAEDRNLFLDKMVAWFDRLFDAWQDETMDDLKHRLKALGVTEEELNEAITQVEAGLDDIKPRRTEN